MWFAFLIELPIITCNQTVHVDIKTNTLQCYEK